MKFPILIGTAMLAFGATAFAAAPASVPAQVQHAWIRWLPAGLPAAGYAVIRNLGDGTLRLTGAGSPDYGMVMLHHSRLARGDSTMERVDHLDIPAHGSVKLAPGGYHLMLSHARRPVKPGDTVQVTLEFAGGTTLQADFSVLPANASGPAD
jgi:copper(I)-binding protein